MSSDSPSFIYSVICLSHTCPDSLGKPEVKEDKLLCPLTKLQVSACGFWRVLKDKQILTILASKTNKATWSLALECDFDCNFGWMGWKTKSAYGVTDQVRPPGFPTQILVPGRTRPLIQSAPFPSLLITVSPLCLETFSQTP